MSKDGSADRRVAVEWGIVVAIKGIVRAARMRTNVTSTRYLRFALHESQTARSSSKAPAVRVGVVFALGRGRLFAPRLLFCLLPGLRETGGGVLRNGS